MPLDRMSESQRTPTLLWLSRDNTLYVSLFSGIPEMTYFNIDLDVYDYTVNIDQPYQQMLA